MCILNHTCHMLVYSVYLYWCIFFRLGKRGNADFEPWNKIDRTKFDKVKDTKIYIYLESMCRQERGSRVGMTAGFGYEIPTVVIGEPGTDGLRLSYCLDSAAVAMCSAAEPGQYHRPGQSDLVNTTKLRPGSEVIPASLFQIIARLMNTNYLNELTNQ